MCIVTDDSLKLPDTPPNGKGEEVNDRESPIKKGGDNRAYPYRVDPDDDLFIVTYPDLPGVVGQGATEEEAVEDANQNKEIWIKERKAQGWYVPEPEEMANTSGNIPLRIPSELHKELKIQAKTDGTSVNKLIGRYIVFGLAAARRGIPNTN